MSMGDRSVPSDGEYVYGIPAYLLSDEQETEIYRSPDPEAIAHRIATEIGEEFEQEAVGEENK
jgi:hypothetical protein